MPVEILRTLCLVALLCLGQASSAAAQDSRVRRVIDEPTMQAIASMASDTDRSEAVLRTGANAESRLALAILLHVFRADTPERNNEIRALLSSLPQSSSSAPFNGRRIPGSHYDGTTSSFGQFFVEAVSAGVHTHAERDGGGYYLIPCGALERNPELIDVLGVWLTKGVPVPKSDCPIDDWRLPQSYYDYINTTHAFVAGANDPVIGKIILSDGLEHRAHMFPLQMLSPQSKGELAAIGFSPDVIPFRRWGLLSLWNWGRYLVVQSKYESAQDDLIHHYVNRFNLGRDMARDVAVRVLWAAVPDYAPPAFGSGDLRFLILSGAPAAEVAERLPATWPHIRFESDVFNTLWGVADPLETIALRHPDALRLLLSRGGDPNVRALPFGKTPLMTAAQLDLPQAVTILLNAGADPNVATDRNAPSLKAKEAWRWVGSDGYYSKESYHAVPDLQHDQRTALMYAAANASLPVIEMLLRAGADKTARDSKGLTAAEYLAGNGPVPANPRLSGPARAEALRLLGP